MTSVTVVGPGVPRRRPSARHRSWLLSCTSPPTALLRATFAWPCPHGSRWPQTDPGQAIADLFAGTHVEVHMITDFHSAAWTNLIANCGVGAVTTLATLLRLGEPNTAD